MLYGRSHPLSLDLFLLFRRNGWLITLTIAASLIIASIFALLQQPIFEAHATLLVQFHRSSLQQPAAGGPQDDNAVALQQAVATEIEILNSRDLKQQVITRLGLDTIYPREAATGAVRQIVAWMKAITSPPPDTGLIAAIPPLPAKPPATEEPGAANAETIETAIARMQDALTIAAGRDSAIIHLGFAHAEPTLAVRVLESLIDVFIAKRHGIYAPQPAPFFEDRLNEYRSRLLAAEDALGAFQATNDLFDPEEQTRLLLAKSVDLEFQIREVTTQLDEMQGKIALVANPATSISSLAPVLTDTELAATRRAQEELLKLRIREAEGVRRPARNNRQAETVAEDINRVRGLLEEQRATGRKRLLLEQKALEARKTGLETDLAAARADIRRINRLSRPLKDLQRAADRREADYTAYANQFEGRHDTSVGDGSALGTVRIVQEPVASGAPKGLGWQVLLALAGLIGLIAGLGFAIIAELRRVPLATPESVSDRLGVTVLANIPTLSR